MTTSRDLNLFARPFFAWGMLVWKAGEMAVASTQVIGHRTSRLTLAGFSPTARDKREFVLMGQEKAQAASASAQAVGVRALMLNQQFAAIACKQMLSAAGSLMSIANSRTTAEYFDRQAKLTRTTMAGSADAASKLSGSTAELAQRALAPINARVKGNVRRLGKKSR